MLHEYTLLKRCPMPESQPVGLTFWLRALFCLSACAMFGASPVVWAADLAASGAVASSTASEPSSIGVPSLAAGLAQRRWAVIPRVTSRLGPKDIGVVINTEDPYSVKVGQYYIKARSIPANQVLRLKLPVDRPALNQEEFAALSRKIDQFYGDRVQGLALAWRMPFAVDCNSITGALTMGFDPALCKQTCAPSRASKYFGSASTRPYQEFKMRLSMLLAAPDANQAKALIDRGVKADGSQGVQGPPPSHLHFVTTSDSVRSSREVLFPPAGPITALNLEVHLDQAESLNEAPRVLLYQTGRVKVDDLDKVDFVPGALADHLTSFGGAIDQAHGQMTVMSWIAAGATASYGTTSEPCSHLQKFPHPQALFLFYAQGATALEAYWKSVAWPQQGLFVGEPLAAPFARRVGP